MDGLVCDRCGDGLLLDGDVRYVVKIEVYAAYDPLELTREDVARDHEGEMRELLERMKSMNAEELQRQVHQTLQFDLCLRCQRDYLKSPLCGGPSGGEKKP